MSLDCQATFNGPCPYRATRIVSHPVTEDGEHWKPYHARCCPLCAMDIEDWTREGGYWVQVKRIVS